MVEMLFCMLRAKHNQQSTESNNIEWIPCSEQLPEEDTEVIVSFAHGLVDVARYKGNGIFESIFEYSTKVIKAWLPVPESYKEEDEECD